MHKGVILLTKASDREEAIDNVESFLESYGDGDVWDWYQIGGRWSNTLASKDKKEEWGNIIKTFLKQEEWGISQQEINNNAVRLQEEWEKLGLKGRNPYSDHYSLPKDGDEYDILPLSECIDVVKEWVKDRKEEMAAVWGKMIEAKKDVEYGKYDMSGYYAGVYRDLNYGNFSFECNVFDTDNFESETIPEEIEGWWAVMVDMHN